MMNLSPMARRLAIACVGVTLMLCILAHVAIAARAAGAPYEIDAILSLTGTGAFIGKDEADGLRIIESSVNRSGGIRGRDVHFAIADDQSSPQVAVQLFNQINSKHPAAVLGPTLSGACNAVFPLAAEGPVLYCLSTSFNPPNNGYAFAYGIPTAGKIQLNLRYFRLRGLTRIGLMTTNDATGQEGERTVRAALALPENASMQLVASEHFGATDLSVTAQMSQLKAASPQAVIAYVSGTPLGTVLHAATEVALDVPMGVSASNFNNKEMEQYAHLLPAGGLYMVIEPFLYPGQLTSPAAKAAATNYIDSARQAGQGAAFSWDAANLIIAGLRAIGPDSSAQQLMTYLVNLHGWYGACGEYDFRNNPHGLTAKDGLVVRYDPAKDDFLPVAHLGTGVPLASK